MATRETLERDFWAMAQSRTANLGITPDCEIHILHLISDATGNIEQHGLFGDSNHLALAEKNLDILIQKMIMNAADQGLDQLYESTYFAAMDDICPLWPFCA